MGKSAEKPTEVIPGIEIMGLYGKDLDLYDASDCKILEKLLVGRKITKLETIPMGDHVSVVLDCGIVELRLHKKSVPANMLEFWMNQELPLIKVPRRDRK